MREGNEKLAFIVHLIIRRVPAHFCETQIDQILLIHPETLDKNFFKLCFAFNTFNSYAQDWKNQSPGRLIFMPHGKGRQMMVHQQQVFFYSAHQKHYLCLWGAAHVIREKKEWKCEWWIPSLCTNRFEFFLTNWILVWIFNLSFSATFVLWSKVWRWN